MPHKIHNFGRHSFLLHYTLRLTSDKLSFGVNSALRQGSTLLTIELVGLLPYPRILPVVQLHHAWQQRRAESLACFPGQQRRQVVDTNDTQGQLAGAGWQLDRHCWFAESCVNVVDRDRVVWVGSVAGNIADHGELAVRSRERLWVDKWWDFRGEVNAVDEYVGLDDLSVRARLR